jgi:hypothetical protein
MNTTRNARAPLKLTVGMAGIIVVLGFLTFLVARLISGHGLGLWRFAHLGQAVIDSRSVSSYSHGDFTSVIFLHHSTGHNLIEQGSVRERFSEAGYDFWDHDYAWPGLRRPDGSPTGYSYNIPDDNTNPDGLARIFAQRAYGLPLNAFSGLLQHEVIAFKSCFPVSHITDDKKLKRFKSYYLDMRDVMDGHLDRIFIVVTPPPLNPAETDAEAAARARAFAIWLKSGEYLDGHANVFTFDFFGYLAQDDPTSPDYNMLRAEYREGSDSHPNQTANETIGPLFVDFIVDAIQRYRVVYESMSFGNESMLSCVHG